MHQESFSVSVRDVARAAARLREFVDQTPMVSPSAVCDATGRTVILKCENLQRTGSFKVRGALHALLQMPPQGRARGVVTDSSGNFGLGLAWGARLLGVEVSIVMPEDAPAVKQERTASLGAKVHLSGATLADRARVADEVALATGAVYVSPHDDLDVIAGQGTAAMEIVEQVSPVESVVVPVGGGGLISGVAVVVKARWPEARVIGVQPSGAADAARSFELGSRVGEPLPESIARGLHANLGVTNWAIVQRLVDDVIVVEDAEIIEASRMLWECSRLLIEPSAAAALAALAAPRLRTRVGDGRAVALLSGGNVDLGDIPWSAT